MKQCFFFAQPFLGVGRAGSDLVMCQPVVAHDFFFQPSLRDQAENELNSQPGAPNRRFARQNGWVNCNVIMAIHCRVKYSYLCQLAAGKSSWEFDKWVSSSLAQKVRLCG